jgi:hypothetical protein
VDHSESMESSSVRVPMPIRLRPEEEVVEGDVAREDCEEDGWMRTRILPSSEREASKEISRPLKAPSAPVSTSQNWRVRDPRFPSSSEVMSKIAFFDHSKSAAGNELKSKAGRKVESEKEKWDGRWFCEGAASNEGRAHSRACIRVIRDGKDKIKGDKP